MLDEAVKMLSREEIIGMIDQSIVRRVMES